MYLFSEYLNLSKTKLDMAKDITNEIIKLNKQISKLKPLINL